MKWRNKSNHILFVRNLVMSAVNKQCIDTLFSPRFKDIIIHAFNVSVAFVAGNKKTLENKVSRSILTS